MVEPNNTFSFDPNKVNKMEGTFEDKNGKSRVVIEDAEPVEIPDNVTLANRPGGKKLVKTNPMLQNIGPGSNGFAGVALLAGIIALAGIVIAYITLKY